MSCMTKIKSAFLLASFLTIPATATSIYYNSFVAQSGVIKGMLSHVLVGCGTVSNAGTGALTGAVLGVVGGIAAAGIFDFVTQRASNYFDCFEVYGDRSLLFDMGKWGGGAIGVLAGMIWGGDVGWQTSSDMLNKGMHKQNPLVSIEQKATAIRTPFCLEVRNDKLFAIPAP